MNKRKGKIPAILMILVIGMLTISSVTLTIVPPISADIQLGTTLYPWPMFHHNLNNTAYTTSPAPDTNRTLWITEVNGVAAGGPTVADGVVFVGGGQSALALNMTTGAILWNYTTGDTIRSAPAVAGGLVFICSNDGYIYAIGETTGNVVWSETTSGGQKLERIHPTVYDGKVFYGDYDGNVTCRVAATGAFVWNYTTGDPVRGCPAIVNNGTHDLLYVGSADNDLYCLNAATGAYIWNFTTGLDIRGSPAVANNGTHDLVYIGSEDTKVYCVDAATGLEAWSYTTGDKVFSSPAVADGKVYIGSMDDKLYCLDASTGAFQWSYTTGADIEYASPAVADGKVFIGSKDDKVYALNMNNGTLIWSYLTEGDIRGSPAVANGLVFIGSFSDGYLYAFGALDGPAPSFTFSPATPSVDETINFDASASCPGFNGTDYVPIASYTWDFGDGNSSFTAPGQPNPYVTHSYSTKGTYNVTLTVTDDNADSNSASANVTAGVAPVASFTYSPPAPNWRDTVNFDASASSDADGTIVSYEWDFGDGTSTETESDPYISHTYNLAGTHTVILTVTDNMSIPDTDTKAITVTVVLGTTGDPWPMFQHDLENTGYTASSAPNTNQTLWITECGNIVASPAVADGLVFVGAQDYNVYAVNMSTGAIAWMYDTGGIVSSSPTVSGGLVFVGSQNGKIYALNETTGDMVWSYTTGSEIRSSPAVSGGLVFVGSMDDKLYCLSTAGVFQWSYTTGGDIVSSPAVVAGKVFFGSKDYNVTCLTTAGAYQWNYTTGGEVLSSPVVLPDDDLVIVGSYENKIYALNENTGAHVWNFTTGDDVDSSPAVASNGTHKLVFVGSDDNTVYCLNAANGASIWNYTTGDDVDSSPAVANGKVFVGSYDDKLHALNMNTGAVVWSYLTGGDVRGPVAVANGTVFAGSMDGNLYAFNLRAVVVVTNIAVSFPLGASKVFPTTGSWKVYVTVEIKNQGGASGTFDITVYYGSSVVDVSAMSTTEGNPQTRTLNPGQNITVQFTWEVQELYVDNTPKVDEDTMVYPQGPSKAGYYIPYDISVGTYDTVLERQETWSEDDTVECHGVGDASGDAHCKGADFTILGMSWWTEYPDPYYDPRADFNGDGDVKGEDFTQLAMHWYEY